MLFFAGSLHVGLRWGPTSRWRKDLGYGMGSRRWWTYIWLTSLVLAGLLQAGAINAEPLQLSPDAAPLIVADHAEFLVKDFPPFEEGLTPQMFYPDIEHLIR